MKNNNKKPDYQRTSLTMPTDFLQEVDKVRGDIPRSKFIMRLLRNVYYNEHNAKWNTTSDLKVKYVTKS